MIYLLTFLEGIISFISPCMLPLLPVYISYFAAGNGEKRKTALRVGCFILGFTLVFTALGVFAGFAGIFRERYETALNVVTGLAVVVFGLSYLEIFHLPFFKGMTGVKKGSGAASAFVFGMVFSVSLSPCVGAFLGSALMLAAGTGGALKGGIMLLCYSLGLGIPLALSAFVLDRLTTVFNFIKRNYKVINTVCGIFLVIMGICMCFGLMSKLLVLVA